MAKVSGGIERSATETPPATPEEIQAIIAELKREDPPGAAGVMEAEELSVVGPDGTVQLVARDMGRAC